MDFTTLKQELQALFKQISTTISQSCKTSLMKNQEKQAQIKTFAKQQYGIAVLLFGADKNLRQTAILQCRIV